MTRFDICEGFYYYAVMNHGGQGSAEYAIFGRLERMGFKPGRDVEHGVLSENAQIVYERLCSGESWVRPQ